MGKLIREYRRDNLCFVIFVAIICIALCPLPSHAEIYQWTDPGGNVIFSDSPPAGVTAKEVRVKENNRTVMQQTYQNKQKVKEKETKKILRDVRDIGVILYMTDWCPYCKKARSHLSSAGASFLEYDIDKDKQKRAEMIQKTGSTSVPVIDIEGTVIRGFVPAAIDSAILKRRQSEE